MTHTYRYSTIASALLVACSLSSLAGCGESRPMAQVRGKVTFADGKMPAAGVRMIRFECAADSNAALRKGASGMINDDGTFEVFTRKPGDGVHLGKYDVTFAICRSVTDQRPLIPQKYTKASSTPFRGIVVDDDKSDLEFTIGP